MTSPKHPRPTLDIQLDAFPSDELVDLPMPPTDDLSDLNQNTDSTVLEVIDDLSMPSEAALSSDELSNDLNSDINDDLSSDAMSEISEIAAFDDLNDMAVLNIEEMTVDDNLLASSPMDAQPPTNPPADDPQTELRRKLRRRDQTILALRRELALLQLNSQSLDDQRARLRELEKERDALRDLEATHLQTIRRLQEECEVSRDVEQTQQETIDRLQDRCEEFRKQNERLSHQLTQRMTADQPDIAALQQQLQDLNARLAFRRDEHTQHVETLENEHTRKQERLRTEIERLRTERDRTQQALAELRAAFDQHLRTLNSLLQNPTDH